MSKRIFFFQIVLLALLLGACAKIGSEASEDMIQPGDRVGDFLITTGEPEGVTYLTVIHCSLDKDPNNETCELPVGTKTNVSWGVYDDDRNSGKTLDETWSEHTYEMLIAGRRVNLQAFGSVDINHPIVGKMRHWNIVIISDKPGEIIIQSSAVVEGEASEGSSKIIFKEQ